MERENTNTIVPSELREVHLQDTNGIRRTAWFFADPTLISMPAWREILEYQIISEEPLNFAINLKDKSLEPYKISYEEFLRAKYYSQEQTENFLAEKLEAIENSANILVGRSSSSS